MRLLSNALALVALLCGSATAGSLVELLEATAANARFPVPARAAVRIERPDGSAFDAVIAGRHATVRLDTADGLRVLIRPGKALVAAGGRRRRAAVGEALPGTTLVLDDLAVFAPRRLRVPQISDESPAGVVVTAAPAGSSPWVLLVHTIDPERAVVVRTQYYRDAINNMVAIRRDDDLVQVGGHWRPNAIAVEDLKNERTTRLRFGWQDAPTLTPGLFTPVGLAEPIPAP